MTVTLAELVWIAVLGCVSGSLGAVTGIGGGVIIVPVLVIVFGFDFATAVASSLAAVVATSTAAGSAYVAEGLTNMRLAMTLEVATTIGGITGGFLGVLLPERALSAIFGVAMLGTAFLLSRGRSGHGGATTNEADPSRAEIPADSGPLDARYRDPDSGYKVVYRVRRVPFGMGVSYGAGTVSGLLGVGGGFIKVPAMNLVMGVPIKVAAATSNFMIGVTAVSSLVVYLGRGEVHPAIVTPLVLGTVVGAIAGTHLQARIPSRQVRVALTVILVFVAIQMAVRAAGVGVG
ncbi:MAG: TSUP family transporter [Actinobacteria bacterium]|nr:TSUP family transporter [Actinomycetota bacterium]